jgi:hypothetical protein
MLHLEVSIHDIERLSGANVVADGRFNKRRPSDTVAKHSSNKRKRVGLETISDDAKTATFNSIPDKIKVDLFNNVVKTAFPNFDNLMVASWNVVSVYSNIGTDFPELHKSIVELKSVLQDFEESVGARVTRSEPKFRRDFAPDEEENGENGDRSAESNPSGVQDSAGDSAAASLGGGKASSQQQDDIQAMSSDENAAKGVSLPQQGPRFSRSAEILRRQLQHAKDTRQLGDNHNGPKPERRSANSTPNLRSTSDSPLHKSGIDSPSARSLSTPTRNLHKSIEASSTTTPSLLNRHDQHRSSNFNFTPLSGSDNEDNAPPTPASKLLSTTPLPDLRALYKRRKHELLHTFGGTHNVPQQYRVQMQDLAAAIKRREREEGGGDEEREKEVDMGKSVLGGKKGGMAPVAKMGGLRRDGGGKKG